MKRRTEWMLEQKFHLPSLFWYVYHWESPPDDMTEKCRSQHQYKLDVEGQIDGPSLEIRGPSRP